MAFVKVYKNNAYFKRFQTQFRRRREGKTDYYARKRLILQDKDKYNSKKYRFVVRITASKVICQVAYATLQGDHILCQADSTELKRFGVTAGLTNYSASYATGLLTARRLLKKTKLDTLYQGAKAVDGTDFELEEKDKKPFRCVLDTGLVRTTTGNKVFAAMKGALDGGLDIPHSTGRFPGTTNDGEETKYDAKAHRDRIYGVPVDNYIAQLKKEGDEDYKTQFSKWDEALKKAGVPSVEKLYTKVFDEIRKNPDRVTRPAKKDYKRDHQKNKQRKLNAAKRRENAIKRIEMAIKKKSKGGKKEK